MGGVDTPLHPTEMIDRHALRDRSNPNLVGNAVSQDYGKAIPDLPIAVAAAG